MRLRVAYRFHFLEILLGVENFIRYKLIHRYYCLSSSWSVEYALRLVYPATRFAEPRHHMTPTSIQEGTRQRALRCTAYNMVRRNMHSVYKMLTFHVYSVKSVKQTYRFGAA